MDKREKIIQTAIRLFVKQGFENTPTSQISKEAKVATGTLFHHFPKKEGLINAAYLYAKKKAVDGTKTAYDSNIKESLRKIWTASLEWGFENKVYIDFIFNFSTSIYITNLTKEDGKLVMEPFEEIIAEGVKTNIMKNLPHYVMVRTYYYSFQTILNQMHRSGKLDKKLISDGFEMIWDAISRA